MKKQYRNSLMASIHETAEALSTAGVMGKQTMREFDTLCLPPVHAMAPEQIRNLPRHRDRQVLKAGELTDDEIAMIAKAEVPAKYAYLDEELTDRHS